MWRKGKIVIVCFILAFFISCVNLRDYGEQYPPIREDYPTSTQPVLPDNVFILKHPDFNFPPSIPDGIKIYYGFNPTENIFIIGKIAIVLSGDERIENEEKNMREKAAEIGGHAIIIVHSQTDTKEFGGNESITWSIPFSMWLGDRIFTYINFYTLTSPKRTFSFTGYAGYIARYVKETEIELAKNWIEKCKDIFPLAKPDEVVSLLSCRDNNGITKYGLLRAIMYSHAIHRFDTELFLIIENSVEKKAEIISSRLSEVIKTYPLARESEIIMFADIKDEKYTIRMAALISHLKNDIIKRSTQHLLPELKINDEKTALSYAVGYVKLVEKFIDLKKKYPNAEIEEALHFFVEIDSSGKLKYTPEEAMKKSHDKRTKKINS